MQVRNRIFVDSFGHEDFMIQARSDFPEVQFCHSTGTKAHTENLANYHNAFASIYEGRYLAGVSRNEDQRNDRWEQSQQTKLKWDTSAHILMQK